MTRAMAAPDAHPAPTAGARLLRDRTFGPWFWGNVVSNSGNWLFNVTAVVVVFQLSGSAFLVGLVSVAQFLPLVVLAPVAGAASDRVDRRRLLLAAQLGSATAATALAVAVVAVGVTGLPGAWPIVATAFGIGVGQAFAVPALNALVPALVRDRDLEDGVALTSLTFNVGRALGPATSGVLLATVGAEAAFVANAASFVVLLGALLVIRPRDDRAPGTGQDPGEDRSALAGLRFVRRDRTTGLLLLGVGATGFAADPIITLAPPLAAVLGGGDTLVSVLVSAFGLAAAPAALVAGRLQRRHGAARVARAGTHLLAGGLVVAALAPVSPVAVAGFGVCGTGFVLAVTGFTSMLQRRVPDAMRGRVMALWTVAFLGNRPLAAAIDGGVADLVGPRPAMSIAVVVAVLGGVLASRVRRREDVSRRAEAEDRA